MGIYMTSHALIGVKFTPIDKELPTKKRGCSHVGSESKFCAECGAPMWKDGTKYERQFEDIHEDFLEPVLETLVDKFAGYAVVAEVYDTTTAFYIGYGASVENFEQARIPLPGEGGPDLDIERILEEVLLEYGVWEQCKDSFGMWAVSEGR